MALKPTNATLEIVQRLGGCWTGHHAMVCCPAHHDRTPSLSIRQGRASILVHCFAGCDGAEVMRGVRQILGGRVAHQCPEQQIVSERPAPFARLWDGALPISGTLAERYLKDCRGIAFIPPDVRFHPRCPMGKGHGVRFLPALLVGVFRRQRLVAVQRLFLDPHSGQRTARMMLGNSRGGTWPSRFNDDGMTIAEGFESACAYWQLTGREAGTCFGVRGFANFELAHGVSGISLLPDNDAEGWRFARRARAARHQMGVATTIIACPSGFGDWADLLAPPGPNASVRN